MDKGSPLKLYQKIPQKHVPKKDLGSSPENKKIYMPFKYLIAT